MRPKECFTCITFFVGLQARDLTSECKSGQQVTKSYNKEIIIISLSRVQCICTIENTTKLFVNLAKINFSFQYCEPFKGNCNLSYLPMSMWFFKTVIQCMNMG